VASRAMQMHNQTGYGHKPVNVTKAILYELMPKGSVLKAPDSLWNATLWSSMLLGNALRGGRVIIIAPSLDGAPSAGFPQMSRAQELLERQIIIQQTLEDEIAAAGGLLRLGLYHPQMGIGEVIARAEAFRTTWEQHEFLQELYDFDPSFFEAMEGMAAGLSAQGFEAKFLTDEAIAGGPKLHLKAQFFASREAWDKLIPRPEWADAFRVFARHRVESMTIEDDLPDLVAQASEQEAATQPLLENFLAELNEEERDRVVFYIGVGSHNMNYRSLMMDGEVMFLLSYFDALPAMLDFIGMTGLCQWPETQEELEALLPAYGGLKRKIGRIIKNGV
jgi:hypothetical protein